MKELFQFSHLAWKISLDDEGPRVMMEKGPLEDCGWCLPAGQAGIAKGGLRNLEDKTYSRSPK